MFECDDDLGPEKVNEVLAGPPTSVHCRAQLRWRPNA